MVMTPGPGTLIHIPIHHLASACYAKNLKMDKAEHPSQPARSEGRDTEYKIREKHRDYEGHLTEIEHFPGWAPCEADSEIESAGRIY